MSVVLPNPCYPCGSFFPVPIDPKGVNFYPTVDRATNAVTSLESLPTANFLIIPNQMIQVLFTYDSVNNVVFPYPQVSEYQLIQGVGSQTTSAPGIVVPLDNPTCYWIQRL